jgi:CubicO group peptidase (beta-lactamase class C family)
LKVLAVILITFFSTKLCSQNAAQIARYLDSTYNVSPFSANILLKNASTILFEKSYGYSDQLKGSRLSIENSFQVASISKQFTAYAIMLLKHQGVLDYDSLVRKYLPKFPYDNITIRHLLTHSSGLPNFWNDIRPHLDHTKSNGNREVLIFLKEHSLPLQFQPGTDYQYCDIGYDFLANIVEIVSGQRYDVFISQRIFHPLGIKNSYAFLVTDISRINNSKLAIGHSRYGAANNIQYAHLNPNNDFVFYLGDFYGDGSIVTTARDLAKWDDALRKCTLLPCEIQNEAFVAFADNGQKHLTKDSKKIDYGFGWKIKRHESLGKIIFHWGSHPGNQHIIYRMLDEKVTLIYLSNFENEVNIKLINGIIARLERGK